MQDLKEISFLFSKNVINKDWSSHYFPILTLLTALFKSHLRHWVYIQSFSQSNIFLPIFWQSTQITLWEGRVDCIFIPNTRPPTAPYFYPWQWAEYTFPPHWRTIGYVICFSQQSVIRHDTEVSNVFVSVPSLPCTIAMKKRCSQAAQRPQKNESHVEQS